MYMALGTPDVFKSQMNQNLNFFSLAILTWQIVKQYILKGNFSRIFFWAINKSKKVKITKTADGFTKTFPKMVTQFNGRNGTESLLCDFIVVLNIAVFLCQWVICGEGLGSKYKAYFTWEMAKEFARFS